MSRIELQSIPSSHSPFESPSPACRPAPAVFTASASRWTEADNERLNAGLDGEHRWTNALEASLRTSMQRLRPGESLHVALEGRAGAEAVAGAAGSLSVERTVEGSWEISGMLGAEVGVGLASANVAAGANIEARYRFLTAEGAADASAGFAQRALSTVTAGLSQRWSDADLEARSDYSAKRLSAVAVELNVTAQESLGLGTMELRAEAGASAKLEVDLARGKAKLSSSFRSTIDLGLPSQNTELRLIRETSLSHAEVAQFRSGTLPLADLAKRTAVAEPVLHVSTAFEAPAGLASPTSGARLKGELSIPLPKNREDIAVALGKESWQWTSEEVASTTASASFSVGVAQGQLTATHTLSHALPPMTLVQAQALVVAQPSTRVKE